MNIARATAISAALLCFPAAFAGTIIDTNLSNGSVIVNVDSRSDGAGNYSDGQTYWYSPFAANGTLLEYTFQPGTYTFQIVDPTDAAALQPGLTSDQLASIYTSWTYNSPYVTDYLVFDSSALTDGSQYQLFTGAVTQNVAGASGWNGGGYNSALEAYNAAYLGGYANQIVAGVGGRVHGTTMNSFTFATTETLVFAIPDNGVGDNGGGVSVLITPTPEPASVALLALGGLALLRRRSR